MLEYLSCGIEHSKAIKSRRYFETYLLYNVYAELRELTHIQHIINKRKKTISKTITAVLNEYFPKFGTVFKHLFNGKAFMHLLKVSSIPKLILELEEDGVLEEIKKAVKKTVGRKKLAQLVEVVKAIIGIDYG